MAIGQTNAGAKAPELPTLATVATTGKGADLVDKNATGNVYALRESRLVTSDTTPTSNGQITWKYE